MRRKDREITDLSAIASVVRQCDVCRLAFFDEEYPYIVPVNFGAVFDENGMPTLYIHGAAMGTKLELMKRDPHVGFEMDRGHRLVTGPRACDYSMEYESVCGAGVLSLVTDPNEKRAALAALMEQYAPGQTHEFHENMVDAIAVLKLTVRSITGKRMKKA